MKKIGLLTITLLGLFSNLYAQQHWCGTDSRLNQIFIENPGAMEEFVAHNANITSNSGQRSDRSAVIIPVVVHVIHDNGIGNISYEQIQSGLDMMNEDFNRLNADTVDTRNSTQAPFEPIAVSMDITFALAKIDPNGNCTNGIERRNSPVATYNAGENAKFYAQGGLDAWPRDQYMNIWVVNSIESDGGAGVTLGYAQFPQFANDGYGVIIRHDSYGNVGTASGDRTLTHEIGHCLGLLHTFQGPFFGTGTGCHTADCGSSGDFCCDTPPAAASHWTCPPDYNSCTSVPVNDFYGVDVFDQWENYMSYAPCQNMFTQGQYDIVSANLADIDFLINLVSANNQVETGVLAAEVLCQAGLYSNTQTICAGNVVEFFDDSYFNVTGWSWTFPGGTPSVSSDQNPVVTYNTGGTYDVTLEVTDGISTVSTTLADYIMILPDPGDAVPYKEGFENLSVLPDNDRFMVTNSNNASTWDLTSTTSYTGNDCAYIDNFGVDDGTKDDLISGTIDLSTIDPSDTLVFYFYYAYKRRTTSDDEWLRFYVSKDCGETWSLRKNIHGSTLGSETSSSEYFPDSQEDWKLVNITNIASDYFVSDFRYKISFENDGGNNIFIDHINMYPISMTSVDELQHNMEITVYPNPASNQIYINCSLTNTTFCNVQIENALGQVVQKVYSGQAQSGENSWDISVQNLETGIYFVTIETETGIQTVKFIKE